MAVSADQTGVQADVGGVGGGHRLQLSGDEILLGDAVLLIQPLHDRQLDALLLLALDGLAAHQDIQLLALDALGQRLLALLRAQMGQQVADDQLGFAALADGDGDGAAVLQGDHAVELQGDGHPLVLADSTVVVGLQVCQLAFLIERGGFQVQPGTVDMSGGNLNALRQTLLADDCQEQHLAPVVQIHLVPGLQLHAAGISLEALLLGKTDALADALALRFSGVQIRLVGRAVGVHGLALPGGHPVITVFLLRQQFLFPFLRIHDLHFLHSKIPINWQRNRASVLGRPPCPPPGSPGDRCRGLYNSRRASARRSSPGPAPG